MPICRDDGCSIRSFIFFQEEEPWAAAGRKKQYFRISKKTYSKYTLTGIELPRLCSLPFSMADAADMAVASIVFTLGGSGNHISRACFLVEPCRRHYKHGQHEKYYHFFGVIMFPPID